jgi:hypothetical protein
VGIVGMPNPAVWFIGILSLMFLFYQYYRKRDKIDLFILIWFLVGLGIVLWSTLTLPVGTLTNPGQVSYLYFAGSLFRYWPPLYFFKQKEKREGFLVSQELS